MRYIDLSNTTKLKIIVPPEILKLKDQEGKDGAYDLFMVACDNAYKDYCLLRQSGILPEDARFLLPLATKTELMTHMNISAWRHFFKRRLNPHAQWEIRKLAKDILYELHTYLPECFYDIVDGLKQKKGGDDDSTVVGQLLH
jgi:thymidylate synthase (FAD)